MVTLSFLLLVSLYSTSASSVGDECSTVTDCTSPQICDLESTPHFCTQSCTSNDDCPTNGYRCSTVRYCEKIPGLQPTTSPAPNTPTADSTPSPAPPMSPPTAPTPTPTSTPTPTPTPPAPTPTPPAPTPTPTPPAPTPPAPAPAPTPPAPTPPAPTPPAPTPPAPAPTPPAPTPPAPTPPAPAPAPTPPAPTPPAPAPESEPTPSSEPEPAPDSTPSPSATDPPAPSPEPTPTGTDDFGEPCATSDDCRGKYKTKQLLCIDTDNGGAYCSYKGCTTAIGSMYSCPDNYRCVVPDGHTSHYCFREGTPKPLAPSPASPPINPPAGGDSSTCVGWKQTSGCTPWGTRESNKDRDCNAVVGRFSSGYCECGDDTTAAQVGCDHSTFTCADACLQTSYTVPVINKDDETSCGVNCGDDSPSGGTDGTCTAYHSNREPQDGALTGICKYF
jgi:hypothetical protein